MWIAIVARGNCCYAYRELSAASVYSRFSLLTDRGGAAQGSGMTNIDQFESAFRSAAKESFSLEDLNVRRILYICDAGGDSDTEYAAAAKRFTATAELLRVAEWEHVSCHGLSDVDALMRRVKNDPPDLICTYRNLGMPATQYPFSLGAYVDVLTQVTHVPVLLLPRPELSTDGYEMLASIDAVMAITDHLMGDHHLVSFAARLAEPRNPQCLRLHFRFRPSSSDSKSQG